MSRRIVIAPTFASSHLLKCWIPNVIQSIKPDVIIINEGIFPQGPENKGHIDKAFRDKWCYSGPDTSGIVGFDWVDTIAFFMDQCVTNDCTGHLVGLNYKPDWDANKCFLTAVSTFHKYKPEVGDLIFPLEPDAFHLESDAEKITSAVNLLKPGEGIQTKWVDFLGTQYYTEAINVLQPKYRRFCYCFDNMENYKSAMDGFMSQNYPSLYRCQDFITYHYPWFVYGKWKELRFELIWRKDPQYWKDFERGLGEIDQQSLRYHDLKITPAEKVWIRPTRSDEARFAQFIDIEHPIAIQSHPNFIK